MPSDAVIDGVANHPLDWSGHSPTHIPHQRLVIHDKGLSAVHVRKLGSGPPLVLVHMSPLSSEFLLPLAAELQHNYTCYLPDTPGYGYSVPLGGEPSIEDYAHRLLQLLSQLGLDQVALYGAHTGAKIGLAAAHMAPGVIRSLVLDGLRLTDDRQRRSRQSDYAPYQSARIGGGHLIDTWFRVWTTSQAWCPAPDPQRRPTIVAGLVRAELAARPWYGLGYRAAFAYDPRPWFQSLRLPSLLLARSSDVLARHLVGYPRPKQVEFTFADDESGEGSVGVAIHRFLAAAAPTSAPARSPEAVTGAVRKTGQSVVSTSYCSVGVTLRSPPKDGEPATVEVSGFPVPSPTCPADIRIDLPGTGMSEWAQPMSFSAEKILVALRECVAGLRLGPVRWQMRGIVPPEVASRLGVAPSAQEGLLSSLPDLHRFLREVRPMPSGSHLVDLWAALTRAPGDGYPQADERRLKYITTLFDHLMGLTVDPCAYIATLIDRRHGVGPSQSSHN